MAPPARRRRSAARFSNFAPQDPVIADFTDPTAIPIGGTFTYASPTGARRSHRDHRERCLAHHRHDHGHGLHAVLGCRHLLQRRPAGIACIDATAHTGVQFDISGTIEGLGCTAQYSTNDSAHTNNAVDPKGSGDSTSYAPQAALMVSPTVTTVMMPFAGPGAPSGGNPAIAVDKSRLTGVQWQFTTAVGTENSCTVDITIDNVRFF